MTIKNLKIARVSTVPIFVVAHLKKQIQYMNDAGANVFVVTSDGEHADQIRAMESVTYKVVNIPRKIELLNDFVALCKLFMLFRREKFNIVHSTTPKAGLLCAIAAKLAGVQVRLHTFTGQPWATMEGFKKGLLKSCDKIIGLLNSKCYADSQSQLDFLVASNIVKRRDIGVLGSGSVAGIDLNRFRSDRYSVEDINQFKAGVGLPVDSKVILFVGRITAEKGVRELLGAFQRLCETEKDTYLVLVGPLEEDGHAVLAQISSQAYEKVKAVGFSSEPEKHMKMADILCLPSYREGFGTVIIEAAAMGTPTVGTAIYGLTDAVEHGKSGLLVPVRDEIALSEALLHLLGDDTLRHEMSAYAQKRAIEKFDTDVISRCLIDEYAAFCGK